MSLIHPFQHDSSKDIVRRIGSPDMIMNWNRAAYHNVINFIADKEEFRQNNKKLHHHHEIKLIDNDNGGQ